MIKQFFKLIKKIEKKLRIEILFLLKRFNIGIGEDEIPKNKLSNYFSKSPVILDVGANNGADSIEMAKLWKRAKIYCFEPVPHIFNLLQYNTRKYKNINPFNLAIGDVNGVIDMYISGGNSNGSSSLLKPKEHLIDHPDVTFNEVIKVRSILLKDWLKENGIEEIDLLWLDIQGLEKRMLESSIAILSKIKVIHTEVSTRETYHGVTLYTEFKTWLGLNGFFQKYEAIPENADMGNALFINERYLNH